MLLKLENLCNWQTNTFKKKKLQRESKNKKQHSLKKLNQETTGTWNLRDG